MAFELNGRTLSAKLLDNLSQTVRNNNLSASLLIIQIGDLPASAQYVALKKKRAEEIGITVYIEQVIEHEEIDIENHVQNIIDAHKDKVDGIMIQLPLPNGADTKKILSIIPKALDVDGLLLEDSPFHTAVADAVVELLKEYVPEAISKKVIIIGDSKYVGGSVLTALNDASFNDISVINEYTINPEQQIKNGEIVISCVGKAELFNDSQLKENAILIDVGTSPNIEGKIVGDFSISNKEETKIAGFTPVPGGVGPMTVAMLLSHTVQTALKKTSN